MTRIYQIYPGRAGTQKKDSRVRQRNADTVSEHVSIFV